MPTLSDKPRQGNRKNYKPIPTPAETQPEGRIPAAANMAPEERPLYMNNSGVDSIPITFNKVHFTQWEVISAMEGCLDLVRDIEENNAHAELVGPLLMVRVTLEYGISQLLSVNADEPLPEVANEER